MSINKIYTNQGLVFRDDASTVAGRNLLKYYADYTASMTNDRMIPDIGWVNAHIGDASGYVKESSLGTDFEWSGGLLEVVGGVGGISQAYVDGSLSTLNASVNTAFDFVESSLNNVLDIAINASTSHQIRFDRYSGYFYGTRLLPLRQNFTMSASEAIVGVTNLILSSSTGTPTFPVTFKKLAGTYITSNVSLNLIYVQYIDPSIQAYTISLIP